jgi:uncharacterized protein YqkB
LNKLPEWRYDDLIRVTERAIEPLQRTRPNEAGYALRVIVMDEGCGCGAPLLYDLSWDFKGPEDELVSAYGMDFIIDSNAKMYLYDPAWIDYDVASEAFRLYSDQQIYNNTIYLR